MEIRHMTYKMADLEWKSSRMYRQEPTGDFTTNRNGRRVPVTKGTEYVTTAGAGTLSIAEWCKLMEAAVHAEGKQELLDRIKAHCKEHCAWLKNDKAVSEYALECLSSKAYKAWGMEE